ncbi:hypothetical protein [Exiguobacterium sp. SRB7LM]|uniref:hypothetical protein n=1 Tax=Exiguobacterium sp. SRB7LM TaxID=2608401 RepID=UPI0018C3E7FD|nr:hypothetical protein [Exiguobacterium sp. SRB7LM]MBG0917115.1 hypothetical protein [Exiguobacterium sp. SRB7LM]
MAKGNCGAKTKLGDMMRRTIIYRWIYAGQIDVPITVINQKGMRQKTVKTRGLINVGLTMSASMEKVIERHVFKSQMIVPYFFVLSRPSHQCQPREGKASSDDVVSLLKVGVVFYR